MEPSEIDVQLDELENRLDRLRALYEQYFLGIEKIEPTVARKDVDRRFWVLRRVQIRNTARRFRLQVLVQRYNTFQQYWTRICREIENGTYTRHLLKAQKNLGVEPLTWAAKKRLGRRRAGTPSEPPAELAEAAAGSQPPGSDLDGLLGDQVDLAAEAEQAAAAALTSAAARQTDARPGTSGAARPPGASAAAPLPARPVHKLEDLGPLDLDFDDDGPTLPVDPRPAPRPAAPVATAAAGRPAPSVGRPALPQRAGANGGATSAVAPLAAGPAQVAASQAGPDRTPLARPAGAAPAAGRPASPAAPVARPAAAPVAAARPAAVPQPAQPPQAAGAARAAGAVRPAIPVAAGAPAAARPAPAAPSPAGLAAARPAPAAPSPAGLAAPGRPAAAASTPAIARAAPPARAQGLTDERLRELHAELVATRRKLNQADNVSLDSLAKTLRDTEAKLRAQHGAKTVEFQVTVKDGKPVVKPLVRK